MRVAYIFISLGNHLNSVAKKVRGQIERLNEIEDTECVGLFFSCEFEKEEKEGRITKIPVPKTNRKYFDHLHQSDADYKRIYEFLIENAENYDRFYLRHNASTRWLQKITELDIDLTIEINGNLPVTIPKHKKKIRRPSDLLHNIGFYYKPYKNEKKYGRKIFNQCRISSTSHELYESFKKFYRIKKDNYFVIGNGIELENIPVRTYAKNEKMEFRLLVLKGAAVNGDYLGLDRVLKGIANYSSNSVQLKMICAGNNFQEENKLAQELGITENVEFVGYLEKEQMSEFVNSSDIAISTLATYRSGIMEISSLKTREYFSRGVPFVYGYTDTDLMDIEESKLYALQLKNDDTPLDFQNIIDHFAPVIKDPDHPKKMRQLAEKYLAMDKKMVNLAEEIRK